jgi:hypothetical protein
MTAPNMLDALNQRFATELPKWLLGEPVEYHVSIGYVPGGSGDLMLGVAVVAAIKDPGAIGQKIIHAQSVGVGILGASAVEMRALVKSVADNLLNARTERLKMTQ